MFVRLPAKRVRILMEMGVVPGVFDDLAFLHRV